MLVLALWAIFPFLLSLEYVNIECGLMRLGFMDESGTKDVKFVGASQKGAKKYFFLGALLIEPRCYHEIVKRWQNPNFINNVINEIHRALSSEVLYGFGKVQDVLNDLEAKLRPILLRQKDELKGNVIGSVIDNVFRKHSIPKDRIDLAVEHVYATILENSFIQCNDVEGRVIYVDKSKVKEKGFEKLILGTGVTVGISKHSIEHIGLLLSRLPSQEKYLSRLVLEVTFDKLWKELSLNIPVVIIADKDFFKEKKIKSKTLSINNVVEILEVDSKDALGISLCDLMLSFTKNLVLHPSVKSKVKDRYPRLLERVILIDVTSDVIGRV